MFCIFQLKWKISPNIYEFVFVFRAFQQFSALSVQNNLFEKINLGIKYFRN